jgi:tetratricopeptide (TPR) repeat protein
MRMTIAIRVFGALLLFGAAAVASSDARQARDAAKAWQQLATLDYDEAAAERPAAGILAPATGSSADAARLSATVAYWLGRYDDLVERQGGATDPEVLFAAANAAFRAARRGQGVGPDAARQLDEVVRAYTRVLRTAPQHADAAYNLEYVARLQNRLAGMKPVPARDRDAPRAAGPIQTTDLPGGPSVHGLPGGPPPEMKTDEFEVLTPRGFEERETDPGQAPGSRIRRKG